MLLLEKIGIRINLFNKIFFSIIIFFIVFSLISVTIFTKQRTSALEQSLIETCKNHALIASTNVESGYLINHWPFKTLKEILKNEEVVYWRIIKQDGEIYLADDAKMWGKRISDVIARTKKMLVKDEIFPKTGEKIKVIVNPLNISENGNWTFWLGFSLKSVAKARKRIIITNSVVTAISIMFMGLLSWYLAKGITVSVKHMVDGTKAVSSGKLGHKIAVKSKDEIGELAISFNKMTESLNRSQDELERLVITDDLTGLFNRRYFYQKTEEEVVRAKRLNEKLSLIMLDLDHFKEYNDTFGHPEGDRVLKETGKIILSSIRDKVDSGCRYGGDEFAVILPGTDKTHASDVAGRIQRSVKEKKMGNVGISAGIVEYDHESSKEDFIKAADDALYEAKKLQ